MANSMGRMKFTTIKQWYMTDSNILSTCWWIINHHRLWKPYIFTSFVNLPSSPPDIYLPPFLVTHLSRFHFRLYWICFLDLFENSLVGSCSTDYSETKPSVTSKWRWQQRKAGQYWQHLSCCQEPKKTTRTTCFASCLLTDVPNVLNPLSNCSMKNQDAERTGL